MEAPYGSPEWWRDRLCKALDTRAKQVRTAEDWFEGRHPLPEPRPYTLASVDTEARLAFNRMAQNSVMNFTPPIVNEPASKCIVTGIRFGEAVSSDPAARMIWQRNQLDADHLLANVEAFKVGSTPVLVWRGIDGKAEISVEDPAQMVIAYQAGSRRKRAAALKRWVDDDERTYCTLYLPNGIYKWVSEGTASTTTAITAWGTSTVRVEGDVRWAKRNVAGEAWPVPNPLGVVTAVELRINTGLKAAPFGGGVPEFTPILTDQLRINGTVFGLLTTAEAQAFRQRWATNWDYPTNEDGSPDKAKMLRAAASGLWALNSDDDERDVKVGEFAQADFRPYIDVLGMELKGIAAKTGTPPYAFLIGDMVNVAADALARIEGTFVAKVRRHMTDLGEAWEEVIRLALRIEGDDRWTDPTLSVIWQEPETRTATEQTVVARTYKDLGAPKEATWAALPDVDQLTAQTWIAQAEAEALLP